MAITLRQPAHMAALPTRRAQAPSRASQRVLGALVSLVAAPWALFWRGDRDGQSATESDRHRLD